MDFLKRKDRKARQEHRNGHRIIEPSHHRRSSWGLRATDHFNEDVMRGRGSIPMPSIDICCDDSKKRVYAMGFAVIAFIAFQKRL